MQEVNVQVAVRVRPLLPKERIGNEAICVRILPGQGQLVIGKDKAFTFDNCFAPKVTQEQLYQKCIDPLVRSCFEGYNATVFAYGQTGSGKTYTIGGGSLLTQTEEELGIIPRAVKQIFDTIQSNGNRSYTIKLSYFEVYKEELRDLLDSESSGKELYIREDNKANTVIVGAAEVECESMDEVMLHVERGSASRRTGSTQMNEQSSRSHAVFTLLIEQRWSDEESPPNESKKPKQDQAGDAEFGMDEYPGAFGHYMCSKFHFVDLAGSERAHRTGNAGDRLKESIHINSGLLALGNVISCLGDNRRKVSHIPYRDSKITRILKDSLGGNAKTLMICCISPASSNLDESLNALKYANRAKNIRNKPIVNRDPRSVRFEEMQSEIKALRDELQRQRTYGITSDVGYQNGTPTDHEHQQLLEEKVARLETECSHYRTIADEAYKQLSEIRERDIMSRSQVLRLGDWLELMEEIKNKVPASLSRDASDKQVIHRMEIEIDQLKRDLQSDEEIFAEKTQEIASMQERISELESLNAELLQKLEDLELLNKNQSQLLISKQVELDHLHDRLKKSATKKQALEPDDVQGPTAGRQRALSVPVHTLGERLAIKEACIRDIHTSPAALTFDRVVQSFRARSQLLVAELEDKDEVLQRTFPVDSPTSDPLLSESVPINSKRRNETDGQDAARSLLSRSDIRRGTYRVKRPQVVRPQLVRPPDDGEDATNKSQTDDEKLLVLTSSEQESDGFGTFVGPKVDAALSIDQMKASTNLQRKKLKQSELDLRQSTRKMKDLAVNIRLKEQLIRELVRNGQEAQHINRQYQQQIIDLQSEKDEALAELSGLQTALKELQNKGRNDKAKTDRLQSDFQKKMESANQRIQSLQKRQKEMEKMAMLTTNDKRIQDLEMAVEKMKQQQEQLQRRLKDEQDRKMKLERDLQREQQRIRDLELVGEQQKKVMKVKLEEMSLMQRKLRSGAHSSYCREEQSRLDEQKKWLDQETEKVLGQRAAAEELEKELSRREEILAKKEAMLAEKSELEMKKLRSSQVINKDIIMVSNKLESVENMIKEKAKEIAATSRNGQLHNDPEMTKLIKERDRLQNQRTGLESKINTGSLLSTQEDRRLIELDEAIEALDAAIDFKNELISSRQAEARRSVGSLVNSEDGLMGKLASLSVNETRTLLTRYFGKVINLKDKQRKMRLHTTELEVKLDEQEALVRDLESNLQQSSADADRKVTKLQQEYEQKIQMLMRKLMEKEAERTAAKARSTDVGSERVVDANSWSLAREKSKEERNFQLEKELYNYKSFPRELKKKLPDGSEINLSASVNSGIKKGSLLASLTEKDFSNPERLSRDPLLKPVALSGMSSDHLTSIAPDEYASGDRLRPSLALLPTTGAPVRVSRRDLRRLSYEELMLRRASAAGDLDSHGTT